MSGNNRCVSRTLAWELESEGAQAHMFVEGDKMHANVRFYLFVTQLFESE